MCGEKAKLRRAGDACSYQLGPSFLCPRGMWALGSATGTTILHSCQEPQLVSENSAVSPREEGFPAPNSICLRPVV